MGRMKLAAPGGTTESLTGVPNTSKVVQQELKVIGHLLKNASCLDELFHYTTMKWLIDKLAKIAHY